MKKVSILSTKVFFETFFGFLVLRKFSNYIVIFGAHSEIIPVSAKSSIDFYEDSKTIGAGLASRDFTSFNWWWSRNNEQCKQGSF